MKLLVGTSGYSYKEWKGIFYPEDLPASEMLAHYSSKLPTVEINNTFYRMPSSKVLTQWSEQVPEGFVFVLKASRRITHQHRLKDADDSVAYLLETSASLGEKLGPILFQLPPFLKKDTSRLEGFLKILPRESKFALEFRHESWFDEEVYDLLRSRNVALCLSDGETVEQTELHPTADWGYLRLRRENYPQDELVRWAEKIKGCPWEEAFVFFKHEEEGPNLALSLTEAANSE